MPNSYCLLPAAAGADTILMAPFSPPALLHIIRAAAADSYSFCHTPRSITLLIHAEFMAAAIQYFAVVATPDGAMGDIAVTDVY